jgi:hypothetical protein
MSAKGLEPGRDLFIDALRLFAMAMVVLGHWSMPVLSYSAGAISTSNALATPGASAITWISQVMPLFFFAGGAANAISWRAAARRGVSAPGWLARRLRRLAWPVVPVAAVLTPLPHLLLALGLPEQPIRTGAQLAGQLLWFLAAYLIPVALTPLLVRADERQGWRVPIALLAGATLVDLVRFGSGVAAIGYLNVAFIWLAVHQLGFRYAQGRLDRGQAQALAIGGFGTALLLVACGPYPGSMIGMPGAEISNMNPPSLALAAFALGQVGLATRLHDRIVALTARSGVARLLAWAGPRLMTVYLWHMPALMATAGLVVVGLGLNTPRPFSVAWFAGWPLWLALLALLLRLLLGCFARLERPPQVPVGMPGAGQVGAALALIGAGLLTLTVAGFAPGAAPLLASLAILGGLSLTGPALEGSARLAASAWARAHERHPEPNLPLP